jgi:hypothetical protein
MAWIALLHRFINPAGSAIVNALGPIRQIVQGEGDVQRRYLVIVAGTAEKHGDPVQIQAPAAHGVEMKAKSPLPVR